MPALGEAWAGEGGRFLCIWATRSPLPEAKCPQEPGPREVHLKGKAHFICCCKAQAKSFPMGKPTEGWVLACPTALGRSPGVGAAGDI